MLKHRILLSQLLKIKKQLYFVANHTTIADVFQQKAAGDAIEIKGWVKTMRKMKENLFFDVSDGSCSKKLQVIIPQERKTDAITPGSSILASGNLSISPAGHLELQANNLEVLGKCIINDGYPFAPRKSYTSEYVRQYLHLRPRTNNFAALLRIRNVINFEIHNYLNSNGFINIHTPILTSNDCEGAGEVFAVIPENKSLLKEMARPNIPQDEIYFGSKVYLSVSGQLHLEIAAHGLSKVYTFGPTFRAENSRSRHHLSEFYMLEAEIAFVNSIEELASFIEDLIKNVTSKVLNQHSDDIATFHPKDNSNILMYLDKAYHVLNLEEATTILSKNADKFKTSYNDNDGLSKEHEIFLVKYCEAPVFIINWPKHMKPFYMKECISDCNKVAALDLLGPDVGEIVGGSLREDSYEKLKAKIPKDSNSLDWYLDLRKFGSVPTAGFGLGLERYIQSMLSINNIRDTIPFPRWAHNCSM